MLVAGYATSVANLLFKHSQRTRYTVFIFERVAGFANALKFGAIQISQKPILTLATCKIVRVDFVCRTKFARVLANRVVELPLLTHSACTLRSLTVLPSSTRLALCSLSVALETWLADSAIATASRAHKPGVAIFASCEARCSITMAVLSRGTFDVPLRYVIVEHAHRRRDTAGTPNRSVTIDTWSTVITCADAEVMYRA